MKTQRTIFSSQEKINTIEYENYFYIVGQPLLGPFKSNDTRFSGPVADTNN